MLRIFLVMVSLSWAGVGVNHNFWNVSFTNFYKQQVHVSLGWSYTVYKYFKCFVMNILQYREIYLKKSHVK